ncbi:hypothetical protein VTJ49DRAFT_741 [Mycothermus thermophilus]|uniref:Uncharacterized protein n=1 Tax=Humicola insolens TaxID=85995 RepID=A0ABR3VF83_HUMIN
MATTDSPWPPDPYARGSLYSAQLPEVARIDSGAEAPEAIAYRGGNAYATGWDSRHASPPVPASTTYVPYKDEGQTHDVSNPPNSQDRKEPWQWLTSTRAVVVMLALIIALLATVTGLATALALQTKRSNDDIGSSSSLSCSADSAPSSFPSDAASSPSSASGTETVTVTSTVVVSPSGTGSSDAIRLDLAIPDVSNGCGDPNQKLTGTTYTTRLFGQVTFTRYCGRELRRPRMYGMLTQDFESCMDACAVWSTNAPEFIGRVVLSDSTHGIHPNATCGAVRFVPAWSDRKSAYDDAARGNCYLYAAPVTVSDLINPALPGGKACHSALVRGVPEHEFVRGLSQHFANQATLKSISSANAPNLTAGPPQCRTPGITTAFHQRLKVHHSPYYLAVAIPAAVRLLPGNILLRRTLNILLNIPSRSTPAIRPRLSCTTTNNRHHNHNNKLVVQGQGRWLQPVLLVVPPVAWRRCPAPGLRKPTWTTTKYWNDDWEYLEDGDDWGYLSQSSDFRRGNLAKFKARGLLNGKFFVRVNQPVPDESAEFTPTLESDAL